MGIYETIGKQLKKAREELGVGQKVLASTLGYTSSAISQYETGKRCILLSDLEKVAMVLNCPLAYFITPAERSSEKKKGILVSLKQYKILRMANMLKRELKDLEQGLTKQRKKNKILEAKIQNFLIRIAELI